MSMDDWVASQYRDECERIRRAVEILEASATRPLAPEEIRILADEAGVNRYTHTERT